MSVFTNVCEFGHRVCGESWLAIKDLQPTRLSVSLLCTCSVYIMRQDLSYLPNFSYC